MRELQPHKRGGIGSSDAEFLGISYTNPHALVNKVGEELTSIHLNRPEAVEIVHDSFDNASGKNKMIYLMEDRSSKKLSIEELLIKSTKELKYVHYLLRLKNQVTKELSEIILATIRRRILDGVIRYDGNYKPLYINFKGDEVKM